jgi:D-serine deaminase-like pyridoxal phosphate-dependent protein
MPDDIESIHTPAFVVNEAVALRNIAAFQVHCDKVGLDLRPHIKTHKSIHFAKAQLAAGAVGITCQKLSEAEAMLADGIDDILITFNILGSAKLARLRALSDRISVLSVVADKAEVVQGLGQAFEGTTRPLTVLVECDTGAKRCGVQTPNVAVELAKEISKMSGLVFGGLMTYPAPGMAKEVAQFMRETKQLLDKEGLACPVVSAGGSPDMWSATSDGIITEYRIGTYIYNDRSLVKRGTCTWDDCAGYVLATVISTPTPARAVVDAGSKVLTSDLLGFPDFGHVLGHPETSIVGLSEEHGILKVDPDNQLKIGERIRIVPNHVCVVSNMFDDVWIENEDQSLVQMKIDARGCVI